MRLLLYAVMLSRVVNKQLSYCFLEIICDPVKDEGRYSHSGRFCVRGGEVVLSAAALASSLRLVALS
jgi:hypothetical protein